jgi:diguanylate cyclase
VAGLVETSQHETAALALDRQAVDLSAVIDAAVETHRLQIASRSQRLSVHLPPPPAGSQSASGTDGPTRVMGDPARLEQIVGNLIDNACRHTFDGGCISLNVSVDDTNVVLTVADDGIGITPQMLPYVFEPFLLDAQALGEYGPGLGIGLTVVRALVRAMGGELAVHSAGTRRGSQFIVTLPRVDAPQETADGR